MNHYTFHQMAARILFALLENRKLSMIRFGDGEAQVMAVGKFAAPEEMTEWPWFWPDRYYIPKPTDPIIPSIQRDLESAVRRADVVGIPDHGDQVLLCWDHLKRPLVDRVFAAWDLKPQSTVDLSFPRFTTVAAQLFSEIRNMKARILVVGKRATEAAATLRDVMHLEVAGAVYYAHYDTSEEALDLCLKQPEWDLCLASVGFSKRLVVDLAERSGKVVIDYGLAHEHFANGWSVL